MSRRTAGKSSPEDGPEQLSLPFWSEPDSPRPLTTSAPATAANATETDPHPECTHRRADERSTPRGENHPSSLDSGPAPSPSPTDPEIGDGDQANAERAESPAHGHTSGSSGNRLSDLVPRFLEFATAIDRSPHTIHTVRVDLALLIRFLGDRPVRDVDLDDLRRYANWLRIERRNDSRSLRRKVASVKAFFAYVANQGIRNDDPAERLIYPSAEPHLPEFLESDEEARLLAAVERPMWRALIVTLLDTGLKRDEVLALHPADVYLDPERPERSYLTVRATNEARKIRVRTLQLTARLATELRQQVETGASDRVFPISVRAVNAIVETTGQRAGLRKRGTISPQMLRDTFAIREVRRRMIREAEARRAAVPEPELLGIRVRHDLEVCDLLGLSPVGTNDPIARYRILAAAGAATAP